MSGERDPAGLKGRAAIEEIDRRLGGLLGPLAEGLARLVDAAEAAGRDGRPAGQAQEATLQTRRGPVRIRTGLSVRVGQPAAPAAAGRDPARPVTPAARRTAAPDDAPAEEPPHDVFATDDQFALTADLPGAGEADLRWTLAEGALTVETPAPRRRRLVAPCPAWLTAEALSVRLANGVLEMTAERRP